jgi:hypothetical protein
MRPLAWKFLDRRMNAEQLGYIWTFIDADDPTPAAVQIGQSYVSGWDPFLGFTYDWHRRTLKYPGDPELRPLAEARHGKEMLLFYPSAWLAIVQLDDKTVEIARLD